MRIDPVASSKSIGSLDSLDPEDNLEPSLQDAVTAAKALFNADGAGLMLADSDGRVRSASASDERAEFAEDNQEVFAQGPCMAAFTERTPMAMRDARAEPQWGEITLVLAAAEIQAALSVPVEVRTSARSSRAPRPTPPASWWAR
jgi:hypothetical protein